MGRKYLPVVKAWRSAWDRVIPFFAFPPAVRKVIYTTNAIESVNARLRKIIKTRGHFPNDDAANKLIWLALRNITAEWKRPSQGWREAMNQFAILYAERFTRPTPQHDCPPPDLLKKLRRHLRASHTEILTRPTTRLPPMAGSRVPSRTHCPPAATFEGTDHEPFAGPPVDYGQIAVSVWARRAPASVSWRFLIGAIASS